MHRGIVFGAALAATSLTSAAQAQTSSPAGGSGAGCELHVWPAGGLNSVYLGWLHGGINNGATTGREGYPQVPTDPMTAAAQVSLLEEAQPHVLLGLTNYRLVIHSDPLTSRAIRTSTARLSDSTSTCYSELIVDDVFFQQDVFSGSDLKISFRFRDFGGAPTPQRIFGTWVHTPLRLLPVPKGENPAAAVEEMKAAYKNDIAQFARAFLTPAKVKKGG
jgi:hypothetical protein